jgi:TP901 family phage tail tape measure protein
MVDFQFDADDSKANEQVDALVRSLANANITIDTFRRRVDELNATSSKAREITQWLATATEDSNDAYVKAIQSLNNLRGAQEERVRQLDRIKSAEEAAYQALVKNINALTQQSASYAKGFADAEKALAGFESRIGSVAQSQIKFQEGIIEAISAINNFSSRLGQTATETGVATAKIISGFEAARQSVASFDAAIKASANEQDAASQKRREATDAETKIIISSYEQAAQAVANFQAILSATAKGQTENAAKEREAADTATKSFVSGFEAAKNAVANFDTALAKSSSQASKELKDEATFMRGVIAAAKDLEAFQARVGKKQPFITFPDNRSAPNVAGLSSQVEKTFASNITNFGSEFTTSSVVDKVAKLREIKALQAATIRNEGFDPLRLRPSISTVTGSPVDASAAQLKLIRQNAELMGDISRVIISRGQQFVIATKATGDNIARALLEAQGSVVSPRSVQGNVFRLQALRGGAFGGVPGSIPTGGGVDPDGSATTAGGIAAGTAKLGLTALGIGTLTAAVFKFVGAVREGAAAQIEFEKNISRVRTVAQDAQLSFTTWHDEIRKLAVTFNRTDIDVATAAYEALQDQVVKGADTFKFLETSLRLSRATFSTATDSTRALDSVLTSFGISAAQAERVAGILFKTVELGRVQLNEVAESFGRTGVFAQKLGISLEETAAVIQTFTIQGVKFDDAQTQLLNIQNQLIKPNEKLTEVFRENGFATAQQAISTLGLIGVLKLLNTEFDKGIERLGELAGDLRAMRGFASATGSSLTTLLDNLKKTTEGFESFGKAVEIAAESAGDRVQRKLIVPLSMVFKAFGQNVVSGAANFLDAFLPADAPTISAKILSAERAVQEAEKRKAELRQNSTEPVSLRASPDDTFAATIDEKTDKSNLALRAEKAAFDRREALKRQIADLEKDLVDNPNRGGKTPQEIQSLINHDIKLLGDLQKFVNEATTDNFIKIILKRADDEIEIAKRKLQELKAIEKESSAEGNKERLTATIQGLEKELQLKNQYIFKAHKTAKQAEADQNVVLKAAVDFRIKQYEKQFKAKEALAKADQILDNSTNVRQGFADNNEEASFQRRLGAAPNQPTREAILAGRIRAKQDQALKLAIKVEEQSNKDFVDLNDVERTNKAAQDAVDIARDLYEQVKNRKGTSEELGVAERRILEAQENQLKVQERLEEGAERRRKAAIEQARKEEENAKRLADVASNLFGFDVSKFDKREQAEDRLKNLKKDFQTLTGSDKGLAVELGKQTAIVEKQIARFFEQKSAEEKQNQATTLKQLGIKNLTEGLAKGDTALIALGTAQLAQATGLLTEQVQRYTTAQVTVAKIFEALGFKVTTLPENIARAINAALKASGITPQVKGDKPPGEVKIGPAKTKEQRIAEAEAKIAEEQKAAKASSDNQLIRDAQKEAAVRRTYGLSPPKGDAENREDRIKRLEAEARAKKTVTPGQAIKEAEAAAAAAFDAFKAITGISTGSIKITDAEGQDTPKAVKSGEIVIRGKVEKDALINIPDGEFSVLPRADGGGVPHGFDTINAKLSHGEYVWDRETTGKYYPLIQSIHALGKQKYFADGGSVTFNGGISLSVNGSNVPQQDAAALARAFQSELRRRRVRFP